MNELLGIGLEFYTYNEELWYKLENGTTYRLTENDYEIIDSILKKIEYFYPKAYFSLCAEYERSKANLPLYRFRIVSRFCKCNFGVIDNVIDIDESSRLNFEHVPCPLRGECRYEHIICHPEFEHHISKAEMRILERWYKGESKDAIANELCLSIHTVNNHIRNVFARLKIHNKAEFVKYADSNNLFR